MIIITGKFYTGVGVEIISLLFFNWYIQKRIRNITLRVEASVSLSASVCQFSRVHFYASTPSFAYVVEDRLCKFLFTKFGSKDCIKSSWFSSRSITLGIKIWEFDNRTRRAMGLVELTRCRHVTSPSSITSRVRFRHLISVLYGLCIYISCRKAFKD
jgi:hypothetical protein